MQRQKGTGAQIFFSLLFGISFLLSLRTLQKLVGDFLKFFCLLGDLAGRIHKKRLKIFGENFGAFSVRNFVAQEKSFVPTSSCRGAVLIFLFSRPERGVITKGSLGGISRKWIFLQRPPFQRTPFFRTRCFSFGGTPSFFE